MDIQTEANIKSLNGSAEQSTIAAISTAVSEAGIGIVRISGPEAFSVASRIYRSKNNNKDLHQVKSHTIHYGYIYDQEEMVDEVLVMAMRAPHTYTGEDTIEIDCHGGVFSVKKVLDTVLKNGARTAAPGEFTKRAFLNGRIDLSQAEAVMDVIRARNESALKSSVRQLKGSVKEAVRGIREALLYEIAYIESALDDPEHISLDGYPAKLEKVVEAEKEKIDRLIQSASDGRIMQEGIRTVILGKPNAGKSSLLNLLLGEDRAIVTDVAGTTRDTLEEYLNLSGITLHLIDTAGIRDTEDIVEKIGVEKARETAKDADLILYVADSSAPLDENDEKIIPLLDDRRAIVLYNKADLTSAFSLEDLRKMLRNSDESSSHPVIAFSAKDGTGKEQMISEIRKMFYEGKIFAGDEITITNARHKEALMEASESLSMVLMSIRNQMPEDFFSIDLMNAYESLGRILGEALSEDLVNEIFRKFCVGK